MIIFACTAALLGTVVAVVHYLFGERMVLVPLFAEKTSGVLATETMRNLTTGMFHLHSMVWAILGIFVLINRLQGGDDLMVYFAAIVFGISGIGNIFVFRRPQTGNILLLLASSACAADIWFN